MFNFRLPPSHLLTTSNASTVKLRYGMRISNFLRSIQSFLISSSRGSKSPRCPPQDAASDTRRRNIQRRILLFVSWQSLNHVSASRIALRPCRMPSQSIRRAQPEKRYISKLKVSIVLRVRSHPSLHPT